MRGLSNGLAEVLFGKQVAQAWIISLMHLRLKTKLCLRFISKWNFIKDGDRQIRLAQEFHQRWCSVNPLGTRPLKAQTFLYSECSEFAISFAWILSSGSQAPDLGVLGCESAGKSAAMW